MVERKYTPRIFFLWYFHVRNCSFRRSSNKKKARGGTGQRRGKFSLSCFLMEWWHLRVFCHLGNRRAKKDTVLLLPLLLRHTKTSSLQLSSFHSAVPPPPFFTLPSANGKCTIGGERGGGPPYSMANAEEQRRRMPTQCPSWSILLSPAQLRCARVPRANGGYAIHP